MNCEERSRADWLLNQLKALSRQSLYCALIGSVNALLVGGIGVGGLMGALTDTSLWLAGPFIAVSAYALFHATTLSRRSADLRSEIDSILNRKGDQDYRAIASLALRLLTAFAWFCGKDNREHIELVQADLMKERRDMRREGLWPSFIFAVMLWKVAGTIIPIVWDGILRFLSAILPIAKLISKIKGL
jgi:hypothetical protein